MEGHGSTLSTVVGEGLPRLYIAPAYIIVDERRFLPCWVKAATA